MFELPRRVRIREVGPRDGFQNEPETIATAQKAELVTALAQTGLRRIELTSFVRPDAIPQLSDAEQLLAALDSLPERLCLSALIPNPRGLERALATLNGPGARIGQATVFLSASESHNRRNLGCAIADSLNNCRAVLRDARAAGLRCEAVISTAFGCPYEGRVQPQQVFAIADSLIAAGAQEVALADTTGMANPRQVAEIFAQARARLDPPPGGAVELTAHFHNTRGQGLANALAALQVGIDSFESSFGELGGCPVPAGATGNVASEDLVGMLDQMGIDSGVDLAALIACARRAQAILGRPLGSHSLAAGPIDWRD